MEGERQSPDFNSPTGENPQVFIDIRSKKEKLVSALILLTVAVAIVVGVYQLTRITQKPFLLLAKNQQNTEQTTATCPGGDCSVRQQVAEILALKAKDTDADGLSDYEEINTYNTSPYLADTDSDGYNDKEEIAAGYDPNCPGKKSCANETQAETAAVGQNQTTNNQAALAQLEIPESQYQVIRDFLLSSGVSQTEVNQLSNDDLLTIYYYLMQQSETAGAGGASDESTVQTAAAPSSLTDLQNLSGAQIRTLLLNEGAPSDMLSQLSDEELRQVFLQKLNEQLNTNSSQ